MLNTAKSGLNRSQLEKLLIISEPMKESIYGIIGRMESLLEVFKSEKEYSSLIPFLETYYLVTKASSTKYVQYRRYFHNIRDHEILDVYFASLYFTPLFKYLVDGKKSTPWEQYFNYISKSEGVPFLQMLLGINAHINSDLYTSIIDLKYKHQHDYFIVNDILLEVVPPVMQFLAFSRRDIIGTLGLGLGDFIMKEFHIIIERWRSEAWINAMLTNPKNKKKNAAKILKNTELLGEKLIREFDDMYHLRNIPKVISDINTLSVNIM